MFTITLPYSGQLLVAHLMAYGLSSTLHAEGHDAFVDHDPESMTFEPRVTTDVELDRVAEVVRASAADGREAVEEDLEPGKRGNDRRAVIWARASFANDPERSDLALERRTALVQAAENEGRTLVADLLGGLGASAAWGRATQRGLPKPSHGATQLDGVMGNNTSDFVRGVLRPARARAERESAEAMQDRWQGRVSAEDLDKTGWAPPGTHIDLADQWLASLGLGSLPVAHRPLARSATPCFRYERGRGSVALPVLRTSCSVPRLRAILGHEVLSDGVDEAQVGRLAALRGCGVGEVVRFDRVDGLGGGNAVAFTFARGRRIDVP